VGVQRYARQRGNSLYRRRRGFALDAHLRGHDGILWVQIYARCSGPSQEVGTRPEKAGVKHLYMFGSTARGEAGPDSDVDLFFDYEIGKIGLNELMDIKELASDILDTKTDMIPRDGLHRFLRDRIEASAIQVF
jgi:predicted nucleotidyltransferase